MNETPPYDPDESFRYDEAPPVDARPGLPWDDRAELGLFRAFWDTMKLVLFEPQRAFAQMRLEEDYKGSLWFLILPGIASALISLVFLLPMLLIFVPLMAANQNAPEMGGAMLLFFGIMVAIVLLTPVLIVLYAFLFSGLWHLLLLVWPGPRRGFAVTFKVYCFAVGATMLPACIPCVGIVAAVWMYVVAIFGLMTAHGTTGWRAALAVLWPVILCGCGYSIFVFMMMLVPALAEASRHAGTLILLACG